jgi:hypothetical protein
MSEENKIIEINGVKFEVDARTATLRQVQSVKIGARVKVLVKDYGDNVSVKHGVVVGFEPFDKDPTVIVAYIDNGYSSNGAEIKFIYFNAKSKEQIIISDENDRESLAASNIVAGIDKAIQTKRNEIQDLEDRKKYFLANFKSYWNALVMPVEEGDKKVVQ